MSRTTKDIPWTILKERGIMFGGDSYPHKYYISPKHHAWFTKQCRKKSRRAAKQELRRGQEPQPKSKFAKLYYD